jgi:hypothetical protein
LTKVALYSKEGEIDHEFDITRDKQNVPVPELIFIQGSGKYYVPTPGVGEADGETVYTQVDCTVVAFKIGGPQHGKPDL